MEAKKIDPNDRPSLLSYREVANLMMNSRQIGMKAVVEFTAREFGIDWSSEKKQLKKWGIDG